MKTSELVSYYLITGRTVCGKPIRIRATTWDDARTAFDATCATTAWPALTATLWRIDPHHRRHAIPGYRLRRAAAAAALTSRTT